MTALSPPPDDADARARLESLWARGRALLGTEFAVLGGAMSWVSERNLVAALSNAGAFGVLACGAMEPDMLAAEIAGTRALTDKPFGVNLIGMHPKLDALVQVCLDAGVGHVVLAGGLPPAPALKALKDGGAKVLAFTPTVALAKRLIRQGVDGLIIEGSEAGGHIGPVSLNVLAQEILPHVIDVPVFVAGGIGHGSAVASFLEMGASGVQIGTLFVVAEESIAHPNFKKAFIKGHARDAVTTVQLDPRFPVIPVRALANAGTGAFVEAQRKAIAAVDAGAMDMAQAQLDIEHFWAGALRRAVIDGDVTNGSLMAGQSVGMVREERPAAAIIGDLVQQTVTALARRTVLGAPC